MSKNVYIDYNIYHTYIAYADISLRKTLLQGICSVHTISCFFKHKKNAQTIYATGCPNKHGYYV